MNSRRFTALRPPVLPTERIAHLSYGMRLLHCGISTRLMTAQGHVWTAPAVQEESDYQRSVRVRSCIRPLSAAVWPLECSKRKLYSITSSARASSVGGISRPIARAVGRLIRSSNLLDCTTGKSAGFAPLSMRPV